MYHDTKLYQKIVCDWQLCNNLDLLSTGSLTLAIGYALAIPSTFLVPAVAAAFGIRTVVVIAATCYFLFVLGNVYTGDVYSIHRTHQSNAKYLNLTWNRFVWMNFFLSLLHVDSGRSVLWSRRWLVLEFRFNCCQQLCSRNIEKWTRHIRSTPPSVHRNFLCCFSNRNGINRKLSFATTNYSINFCFSPENVVLFWCKLLN